MMHAIPYILADDFESIGKLIIFGIVILFWLIQKVAKLAGGGASTSTPAAKRPTPAARAPQQISPRPAGPIPLPPLKTKAAATKRTVKKKQAPPVPASPVAATATAVQRPRSTSTAPMMAVPAQSQVAGWLDARTVRAQFIMAEAMKPPLSLR
jgi:hypothetical protein